MFHSDTPLSEPSSPQDNLQSVFSFYIREPTNINPFNPASFNPTSMSTPKKTHHVSMPTLPARPAPLKPHNLSLDSKKRRKSAPLEKTPSFRPFLIRIQSNAASLEKDTLSRKEFSKPSRGRRSIGVEKTRAEKKAVSLLKFFTLNLKRTLSCKPSSDSTRIKQRAYYFV